MKDVCKAYGCNYERDLGRTLQVPSGYIVEECTWCGDTRTVREAGAL